MLYLAYRYKYFLFLESTWNHIFQDLEALESKSLILHRVPVVCIDIHPGTHTQIHRWMMIRKIDIWESVIPWLKFYSQCSLKTLTLLLNTVPSYFFSCQRFSDIPSNFPRQTKFCLVTCYQQTTRHPLFSNRHPFFERILVTWECCICLLPLHTSLRAAMNGHTSDRQTSYVLCHFWASQ